jgi:GT2 family glycosyltransferase
LNAEASRPRLSVILVNYNDKGRIGRALDSIASAAAGIPHEILVVDNASTDGSADFLEAAYPSVTLLRNAGNAGFSRANNRGAAASRGVDLAFLNTDVVVRPGAFDALLAELDAHPETAACGPALETPRGGFQVSFGGRRTFGRELLEKTLFNGLTGRRLATRRERREVDWVSGAFLVVRRAAFETVGGFDEGFFLYYEDIDLCLRLRAAGRRVMFAPGAFAFHEGGAVTSARPLRSRYEYRRSQLLFYRKHNGPASRFLLRLYLRAGFALLRLRGTISAASDPPRRRFDALFKETGR